MKHFRALVAAAGVIALVAAAGAALGATPKPKTVTFKGAYAGTVTEKVDGQNVTGLTNGTGSSTAGRQWPSSSARVSTGGSGRRTGRSG